jgi:hypothetical protein
MTAVLLPGEWRGFFDEKWHGGRSYGRHRWHNARLHNIIPVIGLDVASIAAVVPLDSRVPLDVATRAHIVNRGQIKGLGPKKGVGSRFSRGAKKGRTSDPGLFQARCQIVAIVGDDVQLRAALCPFRFAFEPVQQSRKRLLRQRTEQRV